MGVGKSTMARKLARKINYEFIDTDKYIEHKYRTSVENIIDSSGIDVFRELEHIALKEIIKNNNSVVATGGGMPCFFNNMDLINQNGYSIYICFPCDIIFYRLKNAKTIRPLIKDKNDEQLMDFIQETLKEREVFYNKADFIFSDRSVRTEKLLDIISTWKMIPA